MKKILLILLVVLLFPACNYIHLPLKVTGKYAYHCKDGPCCVLYMEDESGSSYTSGKVKYEYCGYEIGQEIR